MAETLKTRDALQEKLRDLPKLENTPESDAIFVKKAMDVNLSDSVNKYEKALVTAKKAMTEAGLFDTGLFNEMDKHLMDGKAHVAHYGALVLLANKLIYTAGPQAKALKTQMKTIYDIMLRPDLMTMINPAIIKKVADIMS